VRGICRALADRAEQSPEHSPYPDPQRIELGVLLDDVALAVQRFGGLAAADPAGPTADDVELREALAEAHAVRDRIAGALVVEAAAEPAVWPLHGSLLTDVDRVLREVDLEAGSDARSVRRGPRERRPSLATAAAIRRNRIRLSSARHRSR
jgi:hypothetical protein